MIIVLLCLLKKCMSGDVKRINNPLSTRKFDRKRVAGIVDCDEKRNG